MGLLRYIVQGIGWEVGRQAAKAGIREGADALERRQADGQAQPAPPPPSARELRRRAKAEAKAAKQRQAALDAELRELKKKAGR